MFLSKKPYLCIVECVIRKMKEDLKSRLVEQLKAVNAFWSYEPSSVKDVPDDILVELVMRYLDMDEIDQLFQLYPAKKVKQAWIENMVPDERCYQLNKFFAWYYFGIKNPGQYVKAMATRQINKRQCLSAVEPHI